MVESLADNAADVRTAAGIGLGHLAAGPKAQAVPAVVALLRHKRPEVRESAVLALGRIGPEAKSAIPALVEACNEQQQYLWEAVAWALGTIGPENAIPTLSEFRKAKSWSLRRVAASSLGKAGPPATAALIKFLSDDHPSVRVAAAMALQAVGPEANAAVPALNNALQDSDEAVAKTAARALAHIKTLAGR
jgi:HEAT repeat protein